MFYVASSSCATEARGRLRRLGTAIGPTTIRGHCPLDRATRRNTRRYERSPPGELVHAEQVRSTSARDLGDDVESSRPCTACSLNQRRGLCRPLHIEPKLHQNPSDLRRCKRIPAPSQHGIHGKVKKTRRRQRYATSVDVDPRMLEALAKQAPAPTPAVTCLGTASVFPAQSAVPAPRPTRLSARSPRRSCRGSPYRAPRKGSIRPACSQGGRQSAAVEAGVRAHCLWGRPSGPISSSNSIRLRGHWTDERARPVR